MAPGEVWVTDLWSSSTESNQESTEARVNRRHKLELTAGAMAIGDCPARYSCAVCEQH